jgi:CheY-like chemotaxis protein
MSNKNKILIVDDEPDVLDYLVAIFEDNGYEVVSASGGKEAYELARSNKPTLITLDITMPDQSGVRTYRNIKNNPELNGIPIIVLTATVNSAQSFLELLNGFPGPEGFLNKPIDTKELIKLTETLLTDKKRRDQINR